MDLRYAHDSFEVVLAREVQQPLAVTVDMIAVQETFTALRNHRMKRQLAANAVGTGGLRLVAESALLLRVVRFRVLIPQSVESVEQRLGASEQQITKPEGEFFNTGRNAPIGNIC